MSSGTEDTNPIDKNASEALESFREAMLALVQCPADKRPSEAKSPEAPDRFDTLVGNYAGLLPVLELPSKAAFCATALLGARALQAGRIKVAAQIFEEVNFGTSNVTALVYVMQGVLGFALALVLLFMFSFLMLLVVDVTFLHEADLSYLFTMESLIKSELGKVSIGTVFGFWGGVVSLLLRLPDFEILKDKSRTFLKVLGGTQPLIGGIFAFVLGALISARITLLSG